MLSRELADTATKFYEAALEPSSWPAALESLTSAAGAIGACCLVQNKVLGQVEWIRFSGPCAEAKTDYLAHYAQSDVYTPAVCSATGGTGLWLSQGVPAGVLRKSEWYNDFVLKSGISDILGTTLFENASHAVMFGLHSGGGRTRFAPGKENRIQPLMDSLKRAARIHVELRGFGWRSSAAIQALDQLDTAVIVVGPNGRVFDLNPAAERLIQADDGLTIRNGRLAALRSFEQAKLSTAIAAATAAEDVRAASGYLLVGRRERHADYALTVAPLVPGATGYDTPLAMILVIDPERRVPSKEAVTALFGLSPAEGRLAAALMRGKRLHEIAIESGVEITTLRSQLSSILRKVGVERQTDLVRVLISIGSISPKSA
jgi:DNA-binding CsgD family transcriptional regulator